jgi:hypothetical protein
MKTQFQVALFREIDDATPFATVSITAKMPLGAMVFALNRLHVSSAGRVDVTWGEEQTEFYNVVISGESITYDRAVLQEEEHD